MLGNQLILKFEKNFLFKKKILQGLIMKYLTGDIGNTLTKITLFNEKFKLFKSLNSFLLTHSPIKAEPSNAFDFSHGRPFFLIQIANLLR